LRAFDRQLENYSGLKVSSGAHSCMPALDVLKVKKNADLMPYQPIGEVNVRKFFADIL
jgi:maleate isomerase